MVEQACDYYSLFLGPKAENADIFRGLVMWTIDRHAEWRQGFANRFGDPESIPLDRKTLESFVETKNNLRKVLENLCEKMKKSTEICSPRYIPHMVSDPLIPAIVGYFAGMLCNQNNIVREVSESTFDLEREVVLQFGRLFGYVKSESDRKKIGGYLTSGGTAANFQALWVARNKSYLPFAIKDMVRIYDDMKYHFSVEVRVGDTNYDIREISDEALSDIPPTQVNELYKDLLRSAHEAHIHEDPMKLAEWQRNLVKNAGLRALGLWHKKPGVVLTSISSHYSIWKVCEALGIGIEQCKRVDVDEDYRMKMSDLRNRLEESRLKGEKIIAVVATIGSTETGSIDPLDEIVKLRDEYQFLIHADAAWGGYACCVPESILGSVVKRRLAALKEADSIVVDPHKLGYVPYSCGAVLFKDKMDFEYIASLAPYLFHPGSPPEIDFYGQYTLEGSRSGAMAASCWLAHTFVGLSESGYGKIIGDTIEMTKRLATRLENMKRPYSDFVEIMNKPELNLVCFRLVFKDLGLHEENKINREFYRRMKDDRTFFLSSTDELKHSESDAEAPVSMRVCIMNPFTNEYYIDKLVEEVKKHIDRFRKEVSKRRLDID